MFIELAQKRRSIRNFADREVEPEKIDAIIEAALRAPTGRAARPWEWRLPRSWSISGWKPSFRVEDLLPKWKRWLVSIKNTGPVLVREQSAHQRK